MLKIIKKNILIFGTFLALLLVLFCSSVIASNYVYPTPINNSKIHKDPIMFKVEIDDLSTISCNITWNGTNIPMIYENNGVGDIYCYYNLSGLPNSIQTYTYYVTYTDGADNFNLRERTLTYYPDFSSNSLPALGIIGYLISSLLILFGGGYYYIRK